MTGDGVDYLESVTGERQETIHTSPSHGPWQGDEAEGHGI